MIPGFVSAMQNLSREWNKKRAGGDVSMSREIPIQRIYSFGDVPSLEIVCCMMGVSSWLQVCCTIKFRRLIIVIASRVVILAEFRRALKLGTTY